MTAESFESDPQVGTGILAVPRSKSGNCRVRSACEERTTKERTSDLSLSPLQPGKRTDGFPKGLMEIDRSGVSYRAGSRWRHGNEVVALSKEYLEMTTTLPEPCLIDCARPLGGLEHFFSLVDRHRTVHFAMAAQIKKTPRFRRGALLLTNCRNDTRCCP